MMQGASATQSRLTVELKHKQTSSGVDRRPKKT
jgi:hypothetical protein